MKWGPIFWNFLHTLSATYPKYPSREDKICMMQFFSILPNILPCKLCKDHCRSFLENNSRYFSTAVLSQENLFEFFWAFHNHV